MTKFLFTLIAISFMSFTVNAQTQKGLSQGNLKPGTTASKIAIFKTALNTTSIAKTKQPMCIEFYSWSVKNKERINNDVNLSAAEKQDEINSINTKLRDKFSRIMDANDLKKLATFIK